ncbi:MAG: DUF3006 domain-containing protein [Clostridia bacterium]|nr:DUF3006 domain-containing protein [Clostridia bacterium]
MIVIVDRFVGEMAVVELPDGSTVDMPRVLLPEAAQGDAVSITVDGDETARRKQRAENLMKDLFVD